jgi:hypothetical protein
MSTRACYRFIRPKNDMWNGAKVVTVYTHSDGYPEGACRWIEAALEYSWVLPRFEADDFAAAFVAANKGMTTYYERMARQAKADGDDEDAKSYLKRAEEYRSGRYADMRGGGVRLVPMAGMDAHWKFAGDTEYVYDISEAGGALAITAYRARHHREKPTGSLEKIFSGTLQQMKLWVGKDLIDRYTEELTEIEKDKSRDEGCYRAKRYANLKKELAKLQAEQAAG